MTKCNPNYEDAAFALDRYAPSKAGVIFGLLFTATTLIHIFQMTKSRTWYLGAFIAGGISEFISLNWLLRGLRGR